MHAAVARRKGKVSSVRENREKRFMRRIHGNRGLELFLFLVGNLGMLLMAWILKGDLDHRYPFKVMSVPPSDYYAEISRYLIVAAIFASVGTSSVAFFLLKTRAALAGVC